VSAELEVVHDAGALLGESPVWDERAGALWWVDIAARRVHWHRPGLGDESAAVPEPVGLLVLRESRGVVIGQGANLAVVEELGEPPVPLVEIDAPGQRLNDGHCDAAGRLWTGTDPLDDAGVGMLLRVGPDRAVSVCATGVGVSNGVGFSPDDSVLYHVDSAERTVSARAYEVATGTAGEPRVLFSVPAGEGVPDGLAVDAEGSIWLAVFGGWRIDRIAPDGELLDQIPMPVSHPTSCAFGGPDLEDLFVTSAARPLGERQRGEQPHAGALFRLRAGVRGLGARRFAD
jgi:sugar lactone lactonase YvrE